MEKQSLSVAYLGPSGTYTEVAAIAYIKSLNIKEKLQFCPYPTIFQTLLAVSQVQADLAVVPVENSIEGGVTMTLDSLWQLSNLQIQHAYIIPIAHNLITFANNLNEIRIVYSHPQALAQCQKWLETFLPQAQLITTNSTTEGLTLLKPDHSLAVISSQRASEIYQVPILASSINDFIENYTKFWILSQEYGRSGTHTSLAFSVPANIPGALVKILEKIAKRNINLSRIESRPTKRSLGEYLFFIDLEADLNSPNLQGVLAEISPDIETLKIFGSYSISH